MAYRRDILKYALSIVGSAILYPGHGKNSAGAVPARYWKKTADGVQCTLCPRACVLKPGATGACRTRKNSGEALVTLAYGNPCAIHDDPIEKKPLYHVLPGARAFSLAIAGCNLRCKNCQNYTISQASPLDTPNTPMTPRQVVAAAVKLKSRTIAYTYSEPTVWYEYMYDTARLAHDAGLKNLMITCGYINPEPLRELSRYMDAANIDLKSFSDDIYKKLNAGTLRPVLDTIKLCRELGMWVELTNLVVPQWTDDLAMIKNMCVWIRDTLGPDVPLHFSRFHPMYQLAHLYPTPADVLTNAGKIAREQGLHYVYIGNVAGTDTNTCCPRCKKPVISRKGYLITGNAMKNGACSSCGAAIAGIWDT